VAIVVTRNTLLVCLFAFAAWRLWRLPEATAVQPTPRAFRTASKDMDTAATRPF